VLYFTPLQSFSTTLFDCLYVEGREQVIPLASVNTPKQESGKKLAYVKNQQLTVIYSVLCGLYSVYCTDRFK